MEGNTADASPPGRRPRRSKWLRKSRLWGYRRLGKISLTQRFLLVSIAVIASATLLLGTIISDAVRSGVTEGVAKTAAAGFDSLVANAIGPIFGTERLTDDDRARLNALFEIGSDAQTTRLIQLRIFRTSGEVLFEATDGVVDSDQDSRFAQALAGQITSDVVELPILPAGPSGTHLITLLRLYTPLHESGTDRIFGVAALYYSARSLLDIQIQTQAAVWTSVLVISAAVVALLVFFVSAADRTISRQARQLSANLERSRQLADEVRGLHRSSEQLRLDAIDANEQLLARVGSDIHDGPLQLMTLAILQLTRSMNDAAEVSTEVLKPTVALTTEAMTELRNISAGLVLPELSGLTLEQTLRLAIQRHEGATGTAVSRDLVGLDHRVEFDIQVCLYRVVQESLSNAFRHSGGRGQMVKGRHSDGAIQIDISNSPSGAAQAADPTRPKLGLRGMRLRLEAVGGTMSVEMRQDRTVVRVLVPSAVSSAR
jgi:signal transduction histidine kinase